MKSNRQVEFIRETKETEIIINLDLDNYFEGDINTGSAFLDHMLDLFRKHSGIGLSVTCFTASWICWAIARLMWESITNTPCSPTTKPLLSTAGWPESKAYTPGASSLVCS